MPPCADRVPGCTVWSMNPGTQSELRETDPGTHPRVRVRKARYLAAFAAIGCGSNLAKARVSGLDAKSIWAALRGEQVGERFIAQTVAALQRDEHRDKLAEVGIEATLDSLFEVSAEAAA